MCLSTSCFAIRTFDLHPIFGTHVIFCRIGPNLPVYTRSIFQIFTSWTMSAGVGYVRRDYPMISEMCWQPLSCVLIKIERGYDYFDDFLDQQVTLATPMEIATYFGNLEFLGQTFLETRQRIKITGERFQSHAHTVNLLIEHHFLYFFSWFFFNLQPVGSKSI